MGRSSTRVLTAHTHRPRYVCSTWRRLSAPRRGWRLTVCIFGAVTVYSTLYSIHHARSITMRLAPALILEQLLGFELFVGGGAVVVSVCRFFLSVV